MIISTYLLSLTFAAMFALTSTASAVEPDKETLQDGTIVIITTSQLVLQDTAGKEHTYDIDEKTQFSLDGEACLAQDLRSGLKARVTVNRKKPKLAISIDALHKNPLFANMQEGKVVTADNASLVMIANDAKTHTFIVTKETKVTCDGKECKAADLPADARVRVTKDKTEENLLLVIDAIVKNPEF